MDDDIQDAIGNTVDALLRPHTPPSPSGVLRVADLYSDAGELDSAARSIGLEVVYAHQPGEIVGDISGHDQIPPFDLLTVNLPDGAWEEAFAFALRFLRVRRPVAFLLASVSETHADDDFARTVQEKTRRLGYRVDGNRGFIVGTLWQDAFTWLPDDNARSVMERLAQTAQRHHGG